MPYATPAVAKQHARVAWYATARLSTTARHSSAQLTRCLAVVAICPAHLRVGTQEVKGPSRAHTGTKSRVREPQPALCQWSARHARGTVRVPTCCGRRRRRRRRPQRRLTTSAAPKSSLNVVVRVRYRRVCDLEDEDVGNHRCANSVTTATDVQVTAMRRSDDDWVVARHFVHIAHGPSHRGNDADSFRPVHLFFWLLRLSCRWCSHLLGDAAAGAATSTTQRSKHEQRNQH